MVERSDLAHAIAHHGAARMPLEEFQMAGHFAGHQGIGPNMVDPWNLAANLQ